MMLLLVFFLVLGPIIKKRNNRGIYLHWLYRKFFMTLPGLMNPKGTRRYSD
jgi:hypothetical protein